MRVKVEMGTVPGESWHKSTAAMRKEKVGEDRGGLQKGFESVCDWRIKLLLGVRRDMERELEQSAEHLQVLALRNTTDKRRCTENCPTATRPYTTLRLFARTLYYLLGQTVLIQNV